MLEGHPGDGVVVATVGEYEIYDNTDRVGNVALAVGEEEAGDDGDGDGDGGDARGRGVMQSDESGDIL
jgi:hypothetical protein